MKFGEILKSKRGMALENAILFMLIIFILCTLLISMALVGNYQVKKEKTVLLADVELEQIGEDYLASIRAGENFDENYNKYDYSVEGNALCVWRNADSKKTVVLFVEAELTDGELDVISWRYSLPAQTD